jgi:hypothetical protein
MRDTQTKERTIASDNQKLIAALNEILSLPERHNNCWVSIGDSAVDIARRTLAEI